MSTCLEAEMVKDKTTNTMHRDSGSRISLIQDPGQGSEALDTHVHGPSLECNDGYPV